MTQKRALVVDDNDLFRQSVADLLEEAGYEAILAETPERAEELKGNEKVDVILCDLVMPSEFSSELEAGEGSAMVGVGAIHHFRKFYPETPIIAMSGVADKSTLSAMERFGAKDALKKPFSLEELTSTLSRVVG
ncbi:MAG: response regulator [Bdellovibrionales bacterium]|nr:response regulator [Bdellovibrionales bacterium]